MYDPEHVYRLRAAGSHVPLERSTHVRGRGEETPTRAYDPQRFVKGSRLGITPHETEPRTYYVQSESTPGREYIVRLDGDERCECKDLLYREKRIAGNCKHILAARLQERDPALVPALAELLARALDNLNESLRRTKRKKGAG